MNLKIRSCNKIYILCTISVVYFARFIANKAKRATHLLIFSLYSLMRQQRYAVAGHGGRAGMNRQDEQ